MQHARLALLLVDSQHDDDLVAANADQLLDAPNTPPRQLGEEDHAVDVVVLEELDVCSHLGDLHDLDHNKALQLRVLLLVKPAVC